MPPGEDAYVSVTLLDGGSFSTADISILHEGDPSKSFRLYDWCFYLHHSESGRHILWDVGISSDPQDYTPMVLQVQWPSANPQGPRRTLREQLKEINVEVEQIDTVIMSHAHWDHCRPIRGEFPNATAVFGSGTDEFCSPGHFEDGVAQNKSLWDGRYFDKSGFATEKWQELTGKWEAFGPFPRALDYFGDRSFMIIDAPGHMPGNLAAAARVKEPGSDELTNVVLASDCCHSRDLLLGRKEFAWFSVPGGKACLHTDVVAAKETIARLRRSETSFGMHIAMAHDTHWIELAQDKVLLSMVPQARRQDFINSIRAGDQPP